jgi:acyl transferase domain-containing protein
MSPHPILLPAIQQGLQYADRTGMTLSSLRRNEEEQAAILASLGTLYTLGYPVDWDKLYPPTGNYIKLPLYPWQRERFWFEAPATKRKSGLTHPGSHPLLGQHLSSANGTHIWENEINLESYPYLGDHRVQGTAVFPAAAYVEMALAAANAAFGQGPHAIEKMVFREAIALPEDQAQVVQLLLTPDMPGTVSCQFFSHPVEAFEPSRGNYFSTRLSENYPTSIASIHTWLPVLPGNAGPWSGVWSCFSGNCSIMASRAGR